MCEIKIYSTNNISIIGDIMPESTEKPTKIQLSDTNGTPIDEFLILDTVKEGKARILAQWNFTSQTRKNEDSSTYLVYVYDERVIWWSPSESYSLDGVTIPTDLESLESVEAWIAANANEIMGYAKRAKISWAARPQN